MDVEAWVVAIGGWGNIGEKSYVIAYVGNGREGEGADLQVKQEVVEALLWYTVMETHWKRKNKHTGQ